MWTKLRGAALPQYSLDWLRVIRPSAFMLDLASRRLGAAELLAPLARGLDGILRRRMRSDVLHWTGVPEASTGKGGLTVTEIDQAAFATLIAPLTRQFALQPEWSGQQLAYLLAEASRKPDYGETVFASACAASGAPVGAFLYHVRPGRIARVLQVLALPGQAGPVLDALIGHATQRGAAGLRGRTQPALLAAMLVLAGAGRDARTPV